MVLVTLINQISGLQELIKERMRGKKVKIARKILLSRPFAKKGHYLERDLGLMDVFFLV